MIKIWGRNTSVNVQKVMWAVGELELPHERIDVGGAFGKNKEPAYLAMNPNGLVPERPALDHLERWFAAIEQRPAFKQHVLAIPFV